MAGQGDTVTDERVTHVTLRIRHSADVDPNLWDWRDLLDWPSLLTDDLMLIKPQVYVSVSGGIAEVMETTGEGAVDIVQVDWDVFEDNDPEQWEIDSFRSEIERLVEPARSDAMLSFNEELAKREAWSEARRATEERHRKQRELDGLELTLENLQGDTPARIVTRIEQLREELSGHDQ